jgi:hypothetical protein
MKSVLHLLLVSSLIVLSQPSTAEAAEAMRVGIASAVNEDVSAIPEGAAPRQLTIGEDMFFNEHVITTKTSSAVLQFRDRSTLEVGPNATLIINRSVYNPVESVSEKTITVVAGAFRFVSGVAVKSSQTDIRTPAGTLGIRGSVVIGTVSDQGDVALIPVQGTPTWTNASGPHPVPQGGSLLAIRSNGQIFTTAQVPASFATIVRQVMTQLGVNPPALQKFSPAQQAANAKDHLVSVDQQNRLQASAPNTVVQPLSATGVSDIAKLAASARDAQAGSLSAQDRANLQTSLSYIASVLNVQTVQHDANRAAGGTGVIQELYTVMTPAQLISIATSLAALDPAQATSIALATVELLPGQSKTILASISAAVPGIDTASIQQAADQQNNNNGQQNNDNGRQNNNNGQQDNGQQNNNQSDHRNVSPS